MKKLILTTAIILGLGLTSFADGGGLFHRGENAGTPDNTSYAFSNNAKSGDPTPMLPNHGESTNQPAPLGSGIVVLMGLGAAYMVAKKRKED